MKIDFLSEVSMTTSFYSLSMIPIHACIMSFFTLLEDGCSVLTLLRLQRIIENWISIVTQFSIDVLLIKLAIFTQNLYTNTVLDGCVTLCVCPFAID